jgi:hypothetical protein
MTNGKLFGYDKLTNAQFEIGLILEPFSLSDNLNDMPSNMKVRIVNNEREEYEVNTVCFHEDFNTWWVIKGDTSTYLKTGEYEHELELVEYFEFFNYKHLVNCAFQKNQYTLDKMIKRIFRLGKVGTMNIEYAGFIDKDKKNDFLSFENFTVASALKTIARGVNAIPKLKRVGSTPTLFFVSRNGLDETPRTTMNSQFPIAFEKNENNSQQFQTRSISNLENVLSSDLIVVPRVGGLIPITKNRFEFDRTNGEAIVSLPTKIDRVEFIKLFPQIIVERQVASTTPTALYSGFYVDSAKIKEIVDAFSFTYLNSTDKANIIYPDQEEFGKIRINDGFGSAYYDPLKPFAGYLTLKDKLGYQTTVGTNQRNATFYYEQRTNELVCAVSFAKGLINTAFNSKIVLATKTVFGQTETLYITFVFQYEGFFGVPTLVPFLTYIQVGYVPIGDLKVSYDNDNDAQDEKFFNQSGRLIDSYAVSKLMFSHVQDSVEGVKIRQGRYTLSTDILPLGALISDSGLVYVVNQRSIDYVNGYYSVIYNLSRSRIARSENINADGSIREYAIPDNNLVRRSEIKKDYLEFSLSPSTSTPTPYLPLNKTFQLTNNVAGCNFDYTALVQSTFLPSGEKNFLLNTANYDLYKSKVLVVDFVDNAICGYKTDSSGVQTPIFYTQTSTVNGTTVHNGKVFSLSVVLADEANMANAMQHYKITYTSDPFRNFVPFFEPTNVPSNFLDQSILIQQNNVGFISGGEGGVYEKDLHEIPVIEYQIQANDTIQPNNSIIVGEKLFSGMRGDVSYYYVISDTRFTNENAISIFLATPPSTASTRRVLITRPTARRIDLELFSTLPSTKNSVALQGKHIGIFATEPTDYPNEGGLKLLFAINDYNLTDNNDISIYINNWKI